MPAFAAISAVDQSQAIEPIQQAPSPAETNGQNFSKRSAPALYERNCLACHGVDGTGLMPGVPDLADPNGPLTQSDRILMTRIIEGFSSPGSPMAMPANGGNASLTEQDVSNLIVYMRAKFKP